MEPSIPLSPFLEAPTVIGCRVCDAAFQFRRDRRVLTAIRSALDRHPAAVHVKRVAVFRFASVVGKGQVIPGARLDRLVIRRLRADDFPFTINQPQPRHAFVDLEDPTRRGDRRRALRIAGGQLTGNDQCAANRPSALDEEQSSEGRPRPSSRTAHLP